MVDRIARCIAALAVLAGMGCASTFTDPTGRFNSLEEAQERYTQLVRWGEIKRASAYVEPDIREEFLSYAPAFEKIRITDVDAAEVKLDPSKDTANVDVIYHAYSFLTFEEKRVFETQEWTRYDGVKNNWFVRPEIGEIIAAFYDDAD